MKPLQPALRFLSVFIIVTLLTGFMKTSALFQKDADIVRLKHLEYYGNLIENYKEKTGYYPFEKDSNIPVIIYIAHEEQIEFTKGGINEPHKEVAFKEFVTELEHALQISIKEYYDPQYRPDYKPNYYMYMINNATYYFAIHVHQPFPFARKVSDYYHKIEISNHPNNRKRSISPHSLFKHPLFKTESSKPIKKSGFFDKREQKYLHYTKIAP